MTSRVSLALDLSTTNSGWSKMDLDTKELLSYGELAPRIKNPRKNGEPLYAYPEIQLLKIRDLCQSIMGLLDNSVEKIIIEEINRGKNRLGQKVLDGLHFILLEKFPEKHLHMVLYVDSDGSDGWRSKNGLALQLSDRDKEINKERRKFNKKVARKNQKPIITQKTLACEFVNKFYGTNFDIDARSKDSDVVDAIGLNHFYNHMVLR